MNETCKKCKRLTDEEKCSSFTIKAMLYAGREGYESYPPDLEITEEFDKTLNGHNYCMDYKEREDNNE